MSAQALKIIMEEFEQDIEDNKDAKGIAHIVVSTVLDALLARVTMRIEKECIEIPVQDSRMSLRTTYPTLLPSDIPQCEITACPDDAEWEGWADKRDPLTRTKLNVMRRLFVCTEHKDQLKGQTNAQDVG